ncbi:hypothetical protein [Burkholderia sp. b13]
MVKYRIDVRLRGADQEALRRAAAAAAARHARRRTPSRPSKP